MIVIQMFSLRIEYQGNGKEWVFKGKNGKERGKERIKRSEEKNRRKRVELYLFFFLPPSPPITTLAMIQ